MNTHHGNRITEIAKSKGLNASSLSKMIGKTRPTVEYHMQRPFIKRDILEHYAKALDVDIKEILRENTEEKIIKTNNEDYLNKYLKAVEKIDFLQSVLLKNGIRVDYPNFKSGVPVSVFGRTKHNFFDKRIQKRIHP